MRTSPMPEAREVNRPPRPLPESRHQSESGWSDRFASLVAQYPKVGLGIAAAIGVSLGWFVKRR